VQRVIIIFSDRYPINKIQVGAAGLVPRRCLTGVHTNISGEDIKVIEAKREPRRGATQEVLPPGDNTVYVIISEIHSVWKEQTLLKIGY